MALLAPGLGSSLAAKLHCTHGFVNQTYSFVPGFFAQDNTTATDIPAVPAHFGLLDNSSDRWSTFFDHINTLNEEADNFTAYKVFFLSRHGEGYHNVAEAKYGTPAWNDYWSKLNGDGELVWGPDAELTATGEAQAAAAGEAWKTELAAGLPMPGKFYVSPLSRALKTLEITFSGLLPKGKNEWATVLENCREVYGVHTCDQRRTRTYIHATFPEFRIEPGFTENDLLWTPEVRETDAHVAGRAKQVLDLVFSEDKDSFISVTGHGGIINGFMASVGRPTYNLPTGERESSTGILPIVIKSVYTASHGRQ
ncbi:hypothetical protein C0995_015445 [Termitomyces sp. Mi166|nr:hypothetical protein C0995_015445 [Termitomyces sp. Mi166\